MGFIQRIDTGEHYANAGDDWYAIVEDITENAPTKTGRVLFKLLIGTQFQNRNNDKENECIPVLKSQRKIADELNEHPTTIQRAINWLRKNNWLEICTGGKETQYFVNVDRFNEIKNNHNVKSSPNQAYKQQADELIQMAKKLQKANK